METVVVVCWPVTCTDSPVFSGLAYLTSLVRVFLHARTEGRDTLPRVLLQQLPSCLSWALSSQLELFPFIYRLREFLGEISAHACHQNPWISRVCHKPTFNFVCKIVPLALVLKRTRVVLLRQPTSASGVKLCQRTSLALFVPYFFF